MCHFCAPAMCLPDDWDRIFDWSKGFHVFYSGRLLPLGFPKLILALSSPGTVVRIGGRHPLQNLLRRSVETVADFQAESGLFGLLRRHSQPSREKQWQREQHVNMFVCFEPSHFCRVPQFWSLWFEMKPLQELCSSLCITSIVDLYADVQFAKVAFRRGLSYVGFCASYVYLSAFRTWVDLQITQFYWCLVRIIQPFVDPHLVVFSFDGPTNRSFFSTVSRIQTILTRGDVYRRGRERERTAHGITWCSSNRVDVPSRILELQNPVRGCLRNPPTGFCFGYQGHRHRCGQRQRWWRRRQRTPCACWGKRGRARSHRWHPMTRLLSTPQK